MIVTSEDSEEWLSNWDDFLNDIEMSRNWHALAMHASITGTIMAMFSLLDEPSRAWQRKSRTKYST